MGSESGVALAAFLPLPGEGLAAEAGKGLSDLLGSWPPLVIHTIAAAMLDRLLHKSVVFTITGDSYHSYQAQARKRRPKGD